MEQHTHQSFRRVLWVYGQLLVATLCIVPVRGQEAPVVPVRSGCEVDYPPFCIVHEDGRADGFSIELMRAALGKMGCEVTFRTGPWSEVRGWLERGEIDALPLVGRTPERDALFDFTVPYMTMHGAIVVRDETHDVRNLADLRGRTVGVMHTDNAEEFLQREDRGIEILTTPTFTEALQKLADGYCDAVVVQQLIAMRLIQEMGLTNLRIVKTPIAGFAQDFCFAVKEGNRDMLAMLNEGLALAVADGTRRRLHAKWFAHLELPPDRPIFVGGDKNYPPFEFLNEKGRPAGFNVELTRAVAREMGLDVRIRLGPWETVVNQLRTGEIDALQGMFYSEERDRMFDFSPAYLVSHYVSVVRNGTFPPPTSIEDLSKVDVICQENDYIHGYLREHGLGSRVALAASQEDVVRAVAEGKHDCALAIRVTALEFIEKNGWSNLVLSRRPFRSSEYCYAVANGRSALLAEFAEGLTAVKASGEYQRLHDKWLGVYEPPVMGWRAALKYIAMVAVPLSLITGMALLWSWGLRRVVARRTLELANSEKRYRLLARNTVDCIWVMDLNLTFTYVNPAVEKIFGFTPEEFIGTNLSKYCDEEDFRQMQALAAGKMAGDPANASATFESVLHDKKGNDVSVEVHGTVLFDADGKPTGLQGVTRDITERKRAETRIKHLNRVLRAIRDVNQLITHEGDRGTLLQQSCEILVATRGYRSAWAALQDNEADEPQIVVESGFGENFDTLREKFAHGDWPECCRRVLREETGVVSIHDINVNCTSCPLAQNRDDTAALAGALRHDTKNYGVLVVRLPVGMAEDEEERSLFRELVSDVAYALHTMEEEQGRRQAEQETYEAKATLEAAIENSQAGIIIADAPDGKLRYVNRAGLMIRSGSEEENTDALGAGQDMSSWKILDLDGMPLSREALPLTRALLYGETCSREFIVRRTEEDDRLVWANAAPIRNVDGEVTAAVIVFLDITEHRKAEKALWESQALFRAVVQTIPDLVWLKSPEGVYRACNQRFEVFFGASEAEIVGKTDYDFLPQDLADFFRRHDRRAEERGRPTLNEEWVTYASDGHRELLETIKTPMYDATGRLAGILGIGRDITERKKTEEVLRESEKDLKEAQRLANVGSWSWYSDTGEFHLSDEMYNIIGLEQTSEARVPSEYGTYFTPETWQQFLHAAKTARETGAPYEIELEIIRQHGPNRLVVARGEAMTDDQKKIVGLRGTLQDITEHKLAEAEIESLARFPSENPNPVLRVSATGNILYANEPATSLVRSITVDGAEQLTPEWCDVMQHALATNVANRVEISADKRTYEAALTPFPGQQYINIYARDVTQFQALEDQLRQAQRMEAIGRLAGGVAHDYNNMIMGIMNYTELCRDDLDPKHPVQEWLNEITTEAQRSANLTRQLLAFARKQTIAPQILNINDGVENILKMLRRLIGENIDLSWQPCAEPWAIRIDPGQLDQILANLCVNARDAITGAGKVTIETHNVTIDEAYCADHEGFTVGDFAMLAVSDDGCGMDRQTISNIFEPFFTTKGIGEGTGLGLATVYGIVKQNEGFINVYSELGAGTTFRIYLPRCKDGDPQSIQHENRPASPGGNETILLVEDERSVRTTMRIFLEEFGYTVLAAETPARAIEIAEEHPNAIDLLITDVVMPGMSGRDLSERLHGDYPDIQCIYMSGYTANVIAHRGILEEGVVFLPKPVSRDELARKIREVLGRES